jgi:hypothetical protein
MRRPPLVHLALLVTLVTPLACATPPASGPEPSDPAGGHASPAAPEDPAPSPEPNRCVAEPGSGKRYVGHSPDTCAIIKFGCEEGETYFGDDCGCGCEPVG